MATSKKQAPSSSQAAKKKAAPAKAAPAAKKAPAKKAAPAKAAPAAKKAPAKKAPEKAVAKKQPAKETAAKKAAPAGTKAPAKKAPPAKKKAAPAKAAPAAKKAAPAKAAPAKKEAPKKAAPAKAAPAAKKAAPPAKKEAAKKAAPAKAPVGKSPAKKSSPTGGTVASREATPGYGVREGSGLLSRRSKPVEKRTEGYTDERWLTHQRHLLDAERATYVEQAQALRAEAEQLVEEMEPGDIQFDDESGEGGTTTVDRERDLALSAQALQTVEEIDHAIAKISNKTYGICENCGRLIPKPRLEALPFARLCIDCKSGGLSRR